MTETTKKYNDLEERTFEFACFEHLIIYYI